MPSNGKSASEKPAIAMLTLTKAAEYAGVPKAKIKSALIAPRFASIFGPESGNVRITHFHAEVPDLIEIAPAALDAWKAEKDKPRVGSQRVRGDKPRRYELRFLDAQLEAVRSALAPLGIEVNVAYKSRAGKKRNASAPEAASASNEPEAASAPTQIEIAEVGDLVEA